MYLSKYLYTASIPLKIPLQFLYTSQNTSTAPLYLSKYLYTASIPLKIPLQCLYASQNTSVEPQYLSKYHCSASKTLKIPLQCLCISQNASIPLKIPLECLYTSHIIVPQHVRPHKRPLYRELDLATLYLTITTVPLCLSMLHTIPPCSSIPLTIPLHLNMYLSIHACTSLKYNSTTLQCKVYICLRTHQQQDVAHNPKQHNVHQYQEYFNTFSKLSKNLWCLEIAVCL